MKGDKMNILGITFNQITAKKNAIPKTKISVNNNCKIESIEESKMNLDKTQKAIRVKFSYKTDYSPGMGDIEIKGELIALENADLAKKILDRWEKTKNMEPELGAGLMNNIMAKCSVQTIILSRDLGLPAPIRLPTIKAKPAAAGPAKKK